MSRFGIVSSTLTVVLSASSAVACSDRAGMVELSPDEAEAQEPGSTSDGGATGLAEHAGGASSSTGPAAFEPYPARGIRLSTVYANQGVGVPIVRDGAWVDGSGRNAELIRNRTTLIRGFWEYDDGFEFRTIRSRLTLEMPDGSEEVAERDIDVQGPSFPTSIGTTVHFVVPGELMRVGVRFKIELLEVEPGYEDQPEPTQTSYPPQMRLIGIEDKDMALKVVLVPVQHELDGQACPGAPAPTEPQLQDISDQLYMQNPVERVEVLTRDPVVYSDPLDSFSPLLSFLAQLREDDQADPAAYYYGIVNPCDDGPVGVGGQAITIPEFPTVENAWTRTSVGRWSVNHTANVNVLLHEVGHSQGRRHVLCSGNEGGWNPMYPHEAGDIGAWGFGVLDFALRSPNRKDYMTYCENNWVSDWGWSRVVPFIEETTRWAAAEARAPTGGRVLVGLVDLQAGVESWFVTRGSAQGVVVDGNEPMRLDTADGETVQLDASHGPMGEQDSYVVLAELPEELTLRASMRITRQHAGATLTVPAVRDSGRTLVLRAGHPDRR